MIGGRTWQEAELAEQQEESVALTQGVDSRGSRSATESRTMFGR